MPRQLSAHSSYSVIMHDVGLPSMLACAHHDDWCHKRLAPSSLSQERHVSSKMPQEDHNDEGRKETVRIQGPDNILQQHLQEQRLFRVCLVLIVMQLQDRLFLKIGEKREIFFDGGGNHRINIQLQLTQMWRKRRIFHPWKREQQIRRFCICILFYSLRHMEGTLEIHDFT